VPQYTEEFFSRNSYTAATDTTLFKNPSGAVTKIENIVICNTTATAITVDIMITNEAGIVKAQIRDALSVAANDTVEISTPVRLTISGDQIRFNASATGLHLSGSAIIHSEYATEPVVYGVEWDRNTDTWRHIDEYGNTLTLTTSDFDAHPIWGQMKRVNLDESGNVVAYQGDDNFALDGTNGRVMVQIPKCYVKTQSPSKGVYRWWFSSAPLTGFEVDPAFKQSDGGDGEERDYVYIGAYEGDLYHDGTNLTIHSRTGKQPWTGGQMFQVAFDGGQNEPAIGDEIQTASDTGFYVVDYHVTSGDWSTNDAAGYLWLRKPGDDSCDFVDDEDISNVIQSNTLAGGTGLGVNGAPSGLSLTIGDARTYAQNIGTGWQQWNIWEVALIRRLILVEYANPDVQSVIGRGIVDKADGIGFNGELTGADSIDTNVASNGTGTGTGTDGLTPVAYRGIENLWGNVWTFVDGFNAIDSAYQVLNKEGTNSLQDDIDSGQTPLSSNAEPVTDVLGYQDDILWEPGFELLLLPASVGGSSSSYLYDYLYSHDLGEINILKFGGKWDHFTLCGCNYLHFDWINTQESKSEGTRLSYIGN